MDEVTARINGASFGGWESLTITRTIDSLADAFSMTAPFYPENPQVYEAFKPFGYQPVEIYVDDELILTGLIEPVNPSVTGDDVTINVQGRSRTGVLIDCAIDEVGYQFDGLQLSKIAERICRPFGITVRTIKDSGTLKEARAEPGQRCAEFLQKLAQDSGLILSCNAKGELVIDAPNYTGQPVAAIIQGQGRLKSISGSYNANGRFSSYKLLQQQDGKPDIIGKALDPNIKLYRPTVETGSDSDAVNVTKAAELKRGIAFSAACQISANISFWRTDAGKLWTPGDIVTVKAPGVYIKNETALVIAEASMKLDTGSGMTTDLRFNFPSAYSGTLPGVMSWD